MAKTKQKRATRTAKHTTSATNQPLADHAKGLYLRLIGAVEAKVLAGEVNSTLLREMASVMRAAATLDGEDRAREKMRLTFARELQPSTVIQYLVGLNESELHRVLSECRRRRGTGDNGVSILGDNGVPLRRSGLA